MDGPLERVSQVSDNPVFPNDCALFSLPSKSSATEQYMPLAAVTCSPSSKIQTFQLRSGPPRQRFTTRYAKRLFMHVCLLSHAHNYHGHAIVNLIMDSLSS